MIYQSISYAVGSGDLACVGTAPSQPKREANIISSWATMLSSDGRPSKVLLLKKMGRVRQPRKDDSQEHD
jgi:hypothetical protein